MQVRLLRLKKVLWVLACIINLYGFGSSAAFIYLMYENSFKYYHSDAKTILIVFAFTEILIRFMIVVKIHKYDEKWRKDHILIFVVKEKYYFLRETWGTDGTQNEKQNEQKFKFETIGLLANFYAIVQLFLLSVLFFQNINDFQDDDQSKLNKASQFIETEYDQLDRFISSLLVTMCIVIIGDFCEMFWDLILKPVCKEVAVAVVKLLYL
ncbi:14226_t:CDS:2 [Ambispora leptoticha]|uniref:14226_t:CDS:1 n=1 Tax=Ambispora leptoticha TaxID=144679 RepID=A0A9N8ZXB1_9GLOM|nr:14226_t:CDS:2 [Ambispora leptoticha]